MIIIRFNDNFQLTVCYPPVLCFVSTKEVRLFKKKKITSAYQNHIELDNKR